MSETYYLGAYWGPRGESAEACALRAQTLFRCLADVDPLFSRWFKTARTRKQALKRPLKTDLPGLQAHIQGSILRDDTGLPMEGAGFSVWLWNGGSGSEDVGLNFYCGERSGVGASNSCILNLPYSGPHVERLLTGPVLTTLLRCLVVAWEPDWAIAMSRAHLDVVMKGANPDEYVAWVTYLSQRRGTVPPLPAPVRIERVEDKGTLITLTPERFTASNPDHLALAERVRELLDRAGLLKAG